MVASDVQARLFEAFRTDHAVLGRGLHDLRTLVLGMDATAVRESVARLDRDAGPHIAFEEEDFYPALERFLSRAEVNAMYEDHAEGLALLKDLMDVGYEALAEEKSRAALVRRIEAMETHVSECGELFGAMGGLSDEEKEHLLQDLERWRERAPRWSDRPAPGSG